MIDKKYLPSENFIKALSAALIIILIAIAISYWKPNKDAYTNSIDATSSAQLNAIDTDKDGLPDWQEVLYGTDKNKADTDSDGTNDGDEIKLDRDPLKPNTAKVGQEPNDKIDPNLVADTQKTISEYEGLNPTQKIARNLISNIIASEPMGGNLDSNSVNALVNKAISDIPSKSYLGITKESDLNLIPVDTSTFPSDLKAYAIVYYTQTENFRSLMGKDLSIINDAVTNGTGIPEDKLLDITKKYQTIIDALVKVRLPAVAGSSGSLQHLQIINNIEKLIAIDNDILQTSKQGVSIFTDVVSYNDVMNNIIPALSTIDTMLKIKR